MKDVLLDHSVKTTCNRGNNLEDMLLSSVFLIRREAKVTVFQNSDRSWAISPLYFLLENRFKGKDYVTPYQASLTC